jgi:hypothetical protein
MPRNNNSIIIAQSIAHFIWMEAKNLVAAGYGQDLHGDPLGAEDAIINELDDSTETFRYFDTLIRFVRYVAQIIEQEMFESDRENIAPDDYLDIIDFNSDEEI